MEDERTCQMEAMMQIQRVEFAWFILYSESNRSLFKQLLIEWINTTLFCTIYFPIQILNFQDSIQIIILKI
jgi:hypothetical protein